MKSNLYIILLFFSVLFASCIQKTGNIAHLNIPLDSMINYSNNITCLLLTGDKTLVFIYDGNCGYCINKLKLCDSIYNVNRKDYNQHNCLAILNTKDKYILEYHLEKLNINIPIFIDTGSFFLTSNNITYNNTCLLLDSSNTIIFNGDYLKSPKKLYRAIKTLDKNK